MRIESFSGRYRFLSNFYPTQDGLTVEHHFQAAKTLDPTWRVRILQASSPGEAKKLGRICPIRPDWDSIKNDYMLALLRWKFSDPNLRGMLLATGVVPLIEGNTWGDRYWGAVNGEGLNVLGRLLMQVREECAA